MRGEGGSVSSEPLVPIKIMDRPFCIESFVKTTFERVNPVGVGSGSLRDSWTRNHDR